MQQMKIGVWSEHGFAFFAKVPDLPGKVCVDMLVRLLGVRIFLSTFKQEDVDDKEAHGFYTAVSEVADETNASRAALIAALGSEKVAPVLTWAATLLSSDVGKSLQKRFMDTQVAPVVNELKHICWRTVPAGQMCRLRFWTLTVSETR